MFRYVSNRLITSVVLALFATLVVFLIASVVPGDPILAMLGDLAASKPEIVAEYRARWGLDLPLWQQYWIFLQRLFHGDLGISISTGRPVLADIAQYAPATVELGTIAFVLSIAIGVPFGIVAAVWRDSWVDHSARFISLVGVSSPVFWLAFIALTIFYGWLQIAPGPGRLDPIDFPPANVTGSFLIDSLIAGDWETFKTAFAHLILPSLVLCAATLGLITRITRASMLETLGQDYVRVARAKGMKERAVIVRHALPNALIPLVTVVGLQFGYILGGAIVIETVFTWPGVGLFTMQAILNRDYPVVQASVFILATGVVLINLGVDLLYLWLDPRILLQR